MSKKKLEGFILERAGKPVQVNKNFSKHFMPNFISKHFERKETYTLGEAFKIVLCHPKLRNVFVPSLIELAYDLEDYKYGRRKGIVTYINTHYNFDKTNKTRYLFSLFIKELFRYGHNFMSPKMARTNQEMQRDK